MYHTRKVEIVVLVEAGVAPVVLDHLSPARVNEDHRAVGDDSVLVLPLRQVLLIHLVVLESLLLDGLGDVHHHG